MRSDEKFSKRNQEPPGDVPERQKTHRDLLAIAVALLAAGFTGWQAEVAHLQLSVTKAEATEASQQAEKAREDLKRQIEIADGALSQAKRSARAAETLAGIQAKSLKFGERAYVGVERVQLPRHAEPEHVSFDIRAMGNTPALQVNVAVACDVVPLGHAAEFIKKRSRREGFEIGLMTPGTLKTWECARDVVSIEAPKIKAYANEPPKKKAPEEEDTSTLEEVVLVGRVTYADIFGAKHLTSFCYRATWAEYQDQIEFYPCGTGNRGN